MTKDMTVTNMTITRRAVLLALLALSSGAGLAGAQSAGAGGTTVYRRCEGCADSLRRVFVKKSAERARLERRLRELERQLESENVSAERKGRIAEELANLTLALTEVSTHIVTEMVPRMTMELAPALEQEMRAGLAQSRRALIAVQPHAVFERFAPRGWLGMNVGGNPEEIQVRDGELFLRFAEFPMVVSVDPKSPAEKAGVRRGDLVMAYNGQDVRSRLAMSRILTPEKPVRVRLRRDGATREVQMVAAAVPSYVRERRTHQIAPLPPELHPAPPAPATPRAPRAPRTPEAVTGVTPAPAPSAMVLPRGATVYERPGGFVFTTARDAFVGAQLEALTEEMGEVVGVKRGVLVLKLFPATPAAQSGLKPLDVIVRAAGQEVVTPAALRAIVASRAESTDAVVLEVVRGGAKRKVSVKW